MGSRGIPRACRCLSRRRVPLTLYPWRQFAASPFAIVFLLELLNPLHIAVSPNANLDSSRPDCLRFFHPSEDKRRSVDPERVVSPNTFSDSFLLSQKAWQRELHRSFTFVSNLRCGYGYCSEGRLGLLLKKRRVQNHNYGAEINNRSACWQRALQSPGYFGSLVPRLR
jgi:hypothetical protein